MGLKKWSHFESRDNLSGAEIAEVLRLVAMALLTAACENKDLQRLYTKAVQAVEEMIDTRR